MSYIIDTCVISELVKPAPSENVVLWLESQDELDLHLSVLTISEIRKGISKLGLTRRRRQIEAWLSNDLQRRFSGRILHIDERIAERWGELTASAENDGCPVPVIDGLLAATALVSGFALVTRNLPHFAGTGVAVVDPWADQS